MIRKLIDTFAKKDGKISKTAIFLSIATCLLLILYPFQALFAGVTLFGWWVVPEFSAASATAVMGILSSLYVINHKWDSGKSPTAEDIQQVKEEFTTLVNSIKDDSDAD